MSEDHFDATLHSSKTPQESHPLSVLNMASISDACEKQLIDEEENNAGERSQNENHCGMAELGHDASLREDNRQGQESENNMSQEAEVAETVRRLQELRASVSPQMGATAAQYLGSSLNFLAQNNNMISQFMSQLNEKDQEIRRLQERVDSQNEMITQLKSQLDNKEIEKKIRKFRA